MFYHNSFHFKRTEELGGKYKFSFFLYSKIFQEIINIFGAYVEPLRKYINHTAFLQEWKLNLDAAEYEINIDANPYKPSEKIN